MFEKKQGATVAKDMSVETLSGTLRMHEIDPDVACAQAELVTGNPDRAVEIVVEVVRYRISKSTK